MAKVDILSSRDMDLLRRDLKAYAKFIDHDLKSFPTLVPDKTSLLAIRRQAQRIIRITRRLERLSLNDRATMFVGYRLLWYPAGEEE